VRALDEQTLQIDLINPASYFHTIAYTWVFYPVKLEMVDADPENWWTTAANHIGNGPFTITGIEDGERWSFEANEHYWQGRPMLDGIEYVAFAESADALAAYQAGELDIMGVDPEIRSEVEADSALAAQLLTYPQAATFYLAMSLNQEPFTDARVREAFALAFDRDAFCAEVYPGTCEPARSWMPPGVPGYRESDAVAFDPEVAREALALSSYGSAENLPQITASYFGEPGENDVADDVQWVADQYRDILGIELILEPVEGGELFARTQDADTYPQFMIFNGWFQDYPDPQNWLSVVWRCDASFAQAAGYCNEEFDRLTAMGDTTVDPEERLDAYEQAEKILIADTPGVFAYHPAGLVLIQPSVTGIYPAPVDAVWPGALTSVMTIEKSAGDGTPVVAVSEGS
jgi:oligopeptide transport system substrate-binding protein